MIGLIELGLLLFANSGRSRGTAIGIKQPTLVQLSRHELPFLIKKSRKLKIVAYSLYLVSGEGSNSRESTRF